MASSSVDIIGKNSDNGVERSSVNLNRNSDDGIDGADDQKKSRALRLENGPIDVQSDSPSTPVSINQRANLLRRGQLSYFCLYQSGNVVCFGCIVIF